jgi:hypothetical protein
MEMKLATFVIPSLFTACVMSADPPPPAEEPVVEERALHCYGTTAYYEWQCDTMLGEWQYNLVGTKELNCNNTHEYQGKVTQCFEQAMSACGGGDDENCQLEVACFKPVKPCKRKLDPPPCCIGP